MPFALGWDPEASKRATARMMASGKYCLVAPSAAPLPRAFSLSKYRLGYYDQGQVGTCWGHSAKDVFEVSANVLGYHAFSACRRLILWVGKQLERDGANPADGGSPTDAITSMTTQGVGVAHENLCQYVDDPNVLGTRPPQNVFDDAATSHLVAPVSATSLDNVKRLIFAGHPVANGWDVPGGFEQQGVTFIGPGSKPLGGHSQAILGWAEAGVFDQYAWLQLNNSWGLIYRPLSPAQAALVPGYAPIQPDRTCDAWIRQDFYISIVDSGQAEHVSATDLSGLVRGVVEPAVPGTDFVDAFSVM